MREVDEFVKVVAEFGIERNSILVDEFRNILKNEFSPSFYWECIGTGAFKECYDVKDLRFIVKFPNEENNTEEESRLYNSAIEAGFGKIFVKSFFIPLDTSLPNEFVDSDDYSGYVYDSYNHTYARNSEGHYSLNYVIIQQRAEQICDEVGTRYITEEEEYLQNLILDKNGEIIPFKEFRFFPIVDMNWISKVIELYGGNYFIDLINFLEEERVYDLHCHNLGYLSDGSPVIFDWLS